MIDKERLIRPNKESFKLSYKSMDAILEVAEGDYEILGELLSTITLYEMYGEEPDMNDRVLRALFKMLKNDIDAYNTSWEKTCEKNRKNAQGRWHSDANETDGIRTDANANHPTKKEVEMYGRAKGHNHAVVQGWFDKMVRNRWDFSEYGADDWKTALDTEVAQFD